MGFADPCIRRILLCIRYMEDAGGVAQMITGFVSGFLAGMLLGCVVVAVLVWIDNK